MKHKKALAAFPVIEAKDEWISLAKKNYDESYFVYAENIEVDNNKILLLYLFKKTSLMKKNRKAAFRVFLSKDDYITQDLNTEKTKWLKSSIENLVRIWNWQQWMTCVDDESVKNINDFIGNEQAPLEGLKDFQENIMHNRLMKKHQVMIDKINTMMELVHGLPADFDSWINEETLYKSRYIYYQYKNGRKKMDGFCTYCLTDVTVEGLRHNQEGICPHCNSPITFKAMGKSTNVVDRNQAAIMQKVDGGFIIRYFSIYREYKDHYRRPKTYTAELKRDFYLDEKIKSYEWDTFKQTNINRWCESTGKHYFSDTSLYTNNLDDILKDTPWQYSAIKEFARCKHGMSFDVHRYLETFKKYPFIEYLVKLKLYSITYEITNNYYGGSGRIDYEGNNLRQILKINKYNLPLLQKLDASMDELRLIQVMEEQKLNLPSEQIRYISDKLGCATPLIESAKYTTINKALNYIKFQAGEYSKRPKEACCHNGWYTTTPKSDIMTAYQDWMDYIRFCENLDYDLNNEFVLYPKNLKEAHDREAVLSQAKDNREAAERQKKQREKIKSMAGSLNKIYGMKYKGYVIMAPKDADDLNKEGNDLHHCVGTYVNKIANGGSIVLFVRKADKQDKPYCTIEITDGKVYQCRGKFNEDMTDKLKGLLNKFKRDKLEKNIIRKEAS